jgi:excisionase family DNA binding protein
VPKGKPKLLEALASVCDGAVNFTVAQAAEYLHVPQNRVHKWVSDGRLHPVRVSGHLIFARTDLDRQTRTDIELELSRHFAAGDHPLDAYFLLDGRVQLRDVHRVLLDWARVTGVWIVEGPRGSYARWLQRFGLVRVSPRALRRVIEALLVDQEVGERIRRYFADEPLEANTSPKARARARAALEAATG